MRHRKLKYVLFLSLAALMMFACERNNDVEDPDEPGTSNPILPDNPNNPDNPDTPSLPPLETIIEGSWVMAGTDGDWIRATFDKDNHYQWLASSDLSSTNEFLASVGKYSTNNQENSIVCTATMSNEGTAMTIELSDRSETSLKGKISRENGKVVDFELTKLLASYIVTRDQEISILSDYVDMDIRDITSRNPEIVEVVNQEKLKTVGYGVGYLSATTPTGPMLIEVVCSPMVKVPYPFENLLHSDPNNKSLAKINTDISIGTGDPLKVKYDGIEKIGVYMGQTTTTEYIEGIELMLEPEVCPLAIWNIYAAKPDCDLLSIYDHEIRYVLTGNERNHSIVWDINKRKITYQD